MMSNKNILITLVLFLLGGHFNAIGQSVEIRSHLKKYYDQYGVDGTFVLFDSLANKYIVYNPELSNHEITPASTFKIAHSLIGLETGHITDEKHTINWDGVERQLPVWNKDHDLKDAFKNSTVWYYQELARRIGASQMEYWLNEMQYGNAEISGGIDRFWLSGGLRVTPRQQVDFLRKIHEYELPVSKRSIDVLKKIMISQEKTNFVVRSKTGLGQQDDQHIGWYVGYIKTDNNVFYFANCIKSEYIDYDRFINARTEIVDHLLKEFKIITLQ